MPGLVVSQEVAIPLQAVVDKIVAFLRSQAASFDAAIADPEGDSRWAKVKQMAVRTMAERVEEQQWFEVR